MITVLQCFHRIPLQCFSVPLYPRHKQKTDPTQTSHEHMLVLHIKPLINKYLYELLSILVQMVHFLIVVNSKYCRSLVTL